MEIKNEADRIKLSEKIKEELGIEIDDYRNEDIAETIFELLTFPQYVFTWTIRPILVAIAVFILGFFLN